MNARLYHVQMNVGDAARSFPFYRALGESLGWRVMVNDPDVIGVATGSADLWIMAIPPDQRERGFHRKAVGLNHLAFRVGARDDVDRFHREFLVARGIAVLYGGPREYPEYQAGYYAVFFEDPDRVKLEVAFVP